jgi:hypothetical protein
MTEPPSPSAPRSYRFDIPLAEVGSAIVAEFDRYWNSKRKEGRLPARRDIEPGELKPLLPNMILLDIEREPLRVRIRLVGTRIVQFRGDNTGRYLHELDSVEPARLKHYLAEMRTVVERARPAFACDFVTTRFGAVQEIYVGIWPLAADGRNVDKLVVIEDYGPLKVWQLQPDEDL